MDLRVERTKRSIINAFLELRTKKPIEKITVKELSEMAFINKATFYLHYNDIYDLSEQLENEILDNILSCVPNTEDFILKPKEVTEMFMYAFLSQKSLVEILFSGSRASLFASTLEDRIKSKIYTKNPQYKDNIKLDITLTYLIRGSFYAFLKWSDNVDEKKVIDVIGELHERILTQCDF